MIKVHNREWLERIENGNRDILYFSKNMSTQDGLEKIERHHFICGYNYSLQASGITIRRALFYNHKNDILSLRYSDDNFFLPGEVSKLYIYRKVPTIDNEYILKAIPPITPFNEHAFTKSAIPEGALPIELEDFKQVFQHKGYLFPENKKIEIYKKSQENKGNYIENVLRLANRYLFAETYNEFDEHLKELYKPLLDIHMELFYEELAEVLGYENGETIVNEVLNLLNTTLDYDYLVSKIKINNQPRIQAQFINRKILLEYLKSYKKKVRINPLATINNHTEWFTREKSPENSNQLILAKVAV